MVPPIAFGEVCLVQGALKQSAQGAWIVIASDAVRTQCSASLAAMDQGQLTVVSNPRADGAHGATAAAQSVSGTQVQVLAVEAVGAVVAVLGARCSGHHGVAAVDAGEAFVGSRPTLLSNARACHGDVLGRSQAQWPRRDAVVGSRVEFRWTGGRSRRLWNGRAFTLPGCGWCGSVVRVSRSS